MLCERILFVLFKEIRNVLSTAFNFVSIVYINHQYQYSTGVLEVYVKEFVYRMKAFTGYVYKGYWEVVDKTKWWWLSLARYV